MTSKISFSKLLKQDLKRSGGIIAVIGLMFFLAFTVAGIINLDEMLKYVGESSYTMQEVIINFKEYVSFNYAVVAITMLSAVLCGVTRYSYLHSEVKLDLFHSMPVKREKLYWVQYISGVIQYAVPMMINLLLIIIIGSFRGVVNANVLTNTLIGLFINLLFFLIIYSTTILAMVMTGKVVVGILGVCTFLSYFPCVYFLGMALFSIFFKTFYTISWRAESFNVYLSPVTLYIYIEQKAKDGQMFLPELAIGLVMVVLITALSLFLYKLRNSESAGNAIAFRKTEAAIKFLIVVPISLFAGIIAESMSVQSQDIWLILGIAFGVLIISAVIEFIYYMDFSRILNRKKLLLASFVTAFCIIGIFRLDIFKYDSNIPDKSDVETVAIEINGLYDDAYEVKDASDTSTPYEFTSKHIREQMKVSDLDSVYRIIDSALQETANEGTSSVIVKFRLKNGKEKIRRYTLNSEMLHQELVNLYKDQSFKENVYPIMNMVGDEISQIDYCFLDERQQMELSRKQIIALTDTFREELETLEYEDLKEPSLLRLYFESGVKGGISGSYMIYPHFEKTLSLLKEYGYELQLSINPEKITMMNVSYFGKDDSTQDKSFSDKEEIKKVAVNLISNSSNNYFTYWTDSDYSVSVNYVNEKGDLKSGYVYYAKDQVPEYVKELFNK